MRLMFDFIDENGDGYVNIHEWKQLPKVVLHAKRLANVNVCQSQEDVDFENEQFQLAIQQLESSFFEEQLEEQFMVLSDDKKSISW